MPSWYLQKLDAVPEEDFARKQRMYDQQRHGPNWCGVHDGRWNAPGQRSSISDACSPQLYRSPLFPKCNDGCLCDQTDTHHFDLVDHPADHPYIAVREAELNGADMTVAREMLGQIERWKLAHLQLNGTD